MKSNKLATKVVHCKKEQYDVYIGRPSVYGNPFTHIKDRHTLAEYKCETIEEAIEKYKAYILSNTELMAQLPELYGKTLGCWCISGKQWPIPYRCHGQVLAELAENTRYSLF